MYVYDVRVRQMHAKQIPRVLPTNKYPLLTIHSPQRTTHYSRFTVPSALLTIHSSLSPARYSLLPTTCYLLLTAGT